MKTHALFITLAITTSSVDVYCQEAAAAGDRIHTDTSAIAISMDAKNTAIMAVLQKLTTCNAKKAFYQPSDAGADADGCVAPASPDKVLTMCDGTDASSAKCERTKIWPVGCTSTNQNDPYFGEYITFLNGRWQFGYYDRQTGWLNYNCNKVYVLQR